MIVGIGEEKDLGVGNFEGFRGRFGGFQELRVRDDVLRLGRLDGVFQFVRRVARIRAEEDASSTDDALDENGIKELSLRQTTRLGSSIGAIILD